MSRAEHSPVLVNEVTSHLAGSTDGAFLDLTVGLGGHIKALAEAVSDKARFYGVDRDSKAVEIAKENLSHLHQTVDLVSASYHTIDSIINNFIDKQFDGILLDLGVSSMQIDQSERGFSFRFDGPLDMRFDSNENLDTAADLVNSLSEVKLSQIFFEFGEERNSRKIAKQIVRERQKEMILTTSRLKDTISSIVPDRFLNKSLARIFQALRIAVNQELDKLKEVLPICVDLLKPTGRLAVISYHSLEDRIVKQSFAAMVKGCTCPPEFPQCVCGKEPLIKRVTRKPIVPSEEEISFNPRARSAKLRVVERL